MTIGVPIIDIEPFRRDRHGNDARTTVERVRTACESLGFLVIGGHGIDGAQVASMRDVTRAFFERPLYDKLQWDFPEVGYRASESGSLARTAGQDVPGDLCETFRYSPRKRAGDPDLFPEETGRMKTVWLAWFSSMEALASEIMSLFARALGLEDDWFVPYFERHSSVLIANYYPSLHSAPLPGQLRRGAHTDFGVLTILYQSDDDGGLEVRSPLTGEWIHVPFVPGTFVLNVGDLMERWTNGCWVSTLHRVVNPASSRSGEARISLPFFHRPDPDATVSAIATCRGSDDQTRFPGVNAGEWMAAKQRLIYHQ